MDDDVMPGINPIATPPVFQRGIQTCVFTVIVHQLTGTLEPLRFKDAVVADEGGTLVILVLHTHHNGVTTPFLRLAFGAVGNLVNDILSLPLHSLTSAFFFLKAALLSFLSLAPSTLNCIGSELFEFSNVNHS